MDDQQEADELEQRRQAREGSINAEQENGGGEVGEEDDGQFFVWEQGRKVTLGTLVSRGIPVESAFVFTGKRLKGQGGLMALDDDALVIVRGRVSKVAVVPTRNDEEAVTKVTIETHVAARMLVNADSDEGEALIAPVIEKRNQAKAV